MLISFPNVKVINMLLLANFVTQRTRHLALDISGALLDLFTFFTIAAIATYMK